jgi:DNA-binding response OmpR family regulator
MTTTGQLKLLLVESDGKDRRALTTLLSGSGYQVVSAVDYEGAKKHLASGKPDIAIVSTALEKGPSGFVVLREILAGGRAAIALLPAEDHEAAVGAFRLGASDVLVKPPRASELIAALRTGLGQLAEIDAGPATSPAAETSPAPEASPAAEPPPALEASPAAEPPPAPKSEPSA